MKKDGTATNEIHESRSQLGVTNEDFKSVKEKKLLKKDAKKAVIEWVSRIVTDVEALWGISISKAKNLLGFSVSIKYIQSAVGISYSAAYEYRDLTKPLIDKMIEEGILVIPNESYEAAGIENMNRPGIVGDLTF